MQPFLRVCDVIDRPVFQAADLLAGETGLHHAVRWVHILDISEPLGHIHGGELVLTTGMGFGGDLRRFIAFVQQLIEGRAAGLCIELGATVSEIPEEILGLADGASLPLIVFRQRVRFVDITQDIHKLILVQERQAFFEQDWVEQWLHQSGDRVGTDTARAPSTPLGAGVQPGEHLEPRSKSSPATKLYRVAVLKLDDALLDAASGATPATGDFAADWFNRRSELSLSMKNAFVQHGIRPYLSVRADCVIAILERDVRKTGGSQHASWTETIGAAFEALKHTVQRAGWGTTPCMGIGSEVTDLGDVTHSYLDARSTLTICAQVRGSGWMTCEETGIYQWVAMLGEHPAAAYSSARALTAIVSHDRQHHTHLLETLKVYLDCDRSKQQTADALFIHRQTLYHRLDQLVKLLPFDLDDPIARLFVHVAVYYHLFAQQGEA